MKLSRATLRGVWPALIVPWNERNELDETLFRHEIRSYAGTGIHGLYTGGTTGEFYAQDDATFVRVTAITCEEAHAIGLPVQIGCTALSTRTVCQRIRTAVDAGADAVQIALPFWLELSDEEVISFFDDVAAVADDLPLVLYHTARSKRVLSAQLILALSLRIPTLIGMKDTTSPRDKIAELLQLVPDFAVLGGEHHLTERTAVGGRGTCSSIALLNPEFVVLLYEAIREGCFDEAQQRQATLQRYMTAVLLPMVQEEGLLDPAVDRVQRVAGGSDVGLACQGPYRSATQLHVERLLTWCRQNAPELLKRAGTPSETKSPSELACHLQPET